MAEQLNILGQGRCRYLTSKEMFYKDVSGSGVPRSASGHFWCALTQAIQGPDGQLVDDRQCSKAGRSCYQSV